MPKYLFFNDYSEGVHPAILDLMTRTNISQEEGYGNDTLSREAESLLKMAIKNPRATVHLISGGTQTNMIALASLMKPYESVIAAQTAHINVHETGAIEATGHKIEIIQSADGKLTADKIQAMVDEHTDEHMVKPRVVFISNSTEVGTIYKKVELEALAQVCRKNNLILYLDGARLGSGLCSREADITLPDLARLVDIFYIGGTKNGALLGEALIINNPELQPCFRYHLKQRGALIAKGRILGAQFVGLFRDNLYFDLARHANAMAENLTRAIQDLGFQFLALSTTNQIFPILPNKLIAELQKDYGFYIWAKVDAENSAIRLVTSWATPKECIDEFIHDFKKLAKG